MPEPGLFSCAGVALPHPSFSLPPQYFTARPARKPGQEGPGARSAAGWVADLPDPASGEAV